MKFKLLLLSVFGSVALASAQYTVKDHNDVVLNEGDVIVFDELTYPAASYEFYVTNDNASETIYTRIEYVSETNSSTGSFEQLCYGLCYNDIVVGGTVPPASDIAYAIAVGETTPLGNHFYNDDPGNGTDPIDFVFAFRQYSDEAGTVEIGTPLTFTYRYNPLLSTQDNTAVDFTIQSTVVSSELVVNANEAMSMVVYNLQGRVVKQAQFDAGRQVVNVSDLSSQAYIVQFTNNKGGISTTKFIKQ